MAAIGSLHASGCPLSPQQRLSCNVFMWDPTLFLGLDGSRSKDNAANLLTNETIHWCTEVGDMGDWGVGGHSSHYLPNGFRMNPSRPLARRGVSQSTR